MAPRRRLSVAATPRIAAEARPGARLARRAATTTACCALTALVCGRGGAWCHARGCRRPPGTVALAASASEDRVEYSYITQTYELVRGGQQSLDEKAGQDALSWEDFLPWSDADRKAMTLVDAKVPNWRKAFLMPASEAGVIRRWRVLRDAAGGEDGGLAALERNVGILCIPEKTTRAAAAALVVGLGAEGASEVVRKNPGVLAIKASSLQGGGLQRTVLTAGVIDFFCGPGAPIGNAIGVFLLLAILKALVDVVVLRSGLFS